MNENSNMKNSHIYNHFRWNLDKWVLFMNDHLCISVSFEQIFFELAHNNDIHNEMKYICQHIHWAVYILSFKRKVKIYIKHCSVCCITCSKNYWNYDCLQFIQTLHVLFLALTINFITDFLKLNNDYNTLMMITDKFTKYICFISSRKTDDSVIWANQFFNEIVCFWDLSRQIIFDRDCWFISCFWTQLFKWVCVNLCFITVYHL